MKRQTNFKERNHTVTDKYGVKYSADGKRLLYGNYDLHEYTVRDGVEMICDEAFFDGFLRRIVLPESLKVIGECAFAHCNKLQEVILPSGIEEIRDGAFWGCDSLKRIELPMTAKRIGDTAFDLNLYKIMVYI